MSLGIPASATRLRDAASQARGATGSNYAPQSVVDWAGPSSSAPSGPAPGSNQPVAPWAGPASPNLAPIPTGAGGMPVADLYGNFQTAYQSMYGPELAALQGQAATGLSGLLGLNAAYGMSQQALMQGSAADRALLGNQAAGTAIQRAAAARQLPYLGAMRGYDMQDIQLGKDAALHTAQRDRRLTKSDATARGAMITPGLRSDLSDIDIALWNQISGFKVDETRTDTQYKEQEAQARDRMRLLDNEAAAYGIKGQQLEASLNQGLANLNLQNVMSVNQVMDMLASNDVDQQIVARNIIEASLGSLNNSLATGVIPQFPMMPQPPAAPNPNRIPQTTMAGPR